MIRGLAFGLLLALAACAQSHGGGHGAHLVRAAEPPADHVLIGSVRATDTKNVQVGMNANVIGDGAGDGRLTVSFGLEMLGAIADAKPKQSDAGGDGANAAGPIGFNPAPGRDALKAAMNDLAARYPDRSNIEAFLFRNPAHAYLAYVVFETGGGRGALYYDVTSWAEWLKGAY
jgi:hypothetical protein